MKGMSLTFKVTTSRVVQIGLKALDASTSYTINNGDPVTLDAGTDMFYKVLNKGTASEQTITINNTGDGILSITKLKICDDPGADIVPMTVDEINAALAGVVGESATFTAAEIEAAAQNLVPDGYALKDQAADVTVAYGESSPSASARKRSPPSLNSLRSPRSPPSPSSPNSPTSPQTSFPP